MRNIQKSEKKDRKEMIQYINLQLAAIGQPLFTDNRSEERRVGKEFI